MNEYKTCNEHCPKDEHFCSHGCRICGNHYPMNECLVCENRMCDLCCLFGKSMKKVNGTRWGGDEIYVDGICKNCVLEEVANSKTAKP